MTPEAKTAIAAKITAVLSQELEGYTRAAKAAQAAATDPDSKAENKYDTRNLEASYLARGVAFRVVETQAALAEWEALPPQDFSAMLPVAVGALIVLESAQGPAGYFMGPGGGGVSVEHEGLEITVITPASPLGKQLLKRREGEIFLLETESRRERTLIVAVV
jgi:hypothetical protein